MRGGNSVDKVELQKFQNGAVIEMFNEELRKVIENIEDENTVAKAERSITIKIAIKPDRTRRTADVTVQTSSTLAKIKAAESLLFFDRDDQGALSAYEDYPGPEFPGLPESQIKPFPKAINGG
jgi:hypothetical protein